MNWKETVRIKFGIVIWSVERAKKEGYRTSEVRVSAINDDGTEKIFWYGVEPEDVQKFMDAFLKIYSAKSMSIIDTNPIVKSAIIHLLFLRIHPYKDGNGRTSRILHSKKFTESINHVYGRKLKLYRCFCSYKDN